MFDRNNNSHLPFWMLYRKENNRDIEYFKLNTLVLNKTGNVRIYVILRRVQVQYLMPGALIQQ
jgi:hypothetical protein